VKQRECWEAVSSTNCFHLSTFGEKNKLITLILAIKMLRLYSDHQVPCDCRDANHKHMRPPVSHIVVYQGCATFITEGLNAIKQIRLQATPSFCTDCLVLVTGTKIHFAVLHLARGPQVTHPCRTL